MNYHPSLLTIFITGPRKMMMAWMKKYAKYYQPVIVRHPLDELKGRVSYALAQGVPLPTETVLQTSQRLWEQYNWGIHPSSLLDDGIALRIHTETSKQPVDIGDIICSQSAEFSELCLDVTYSNLLMSDTVQELFVAGKNVLFSNISALGRHMCQAELEASREICPRQIVTHVPINASIEDLRRCYETSVEVQLERIFNVTVGQIVALFEGAGAGNQTFDEKHKAITDLFVGGLLEMRQQIIRQ